MATRAGVPDAIAEVLITDELLARPIPAPDYLGEKLAIQDLAQQMADNPAEVLSRLVKLAVEICEADSAGISVLEGDRFRWRDLTGKLAVFEGKTTPRTFSPCGICLDQARPIVMARPERAYEWMAQAKISLPEVLLVPLLVDGGTELGTLWIIARERQHFHSGHERIMRELAALTGSALRMVQSDSRLKKALDDQVMLTKEMKHRISNLLAITDSIIYLTARNSATKEEMTASLSARLHALADAQSLVRSASGEPKRCGVDLGELIEIILRPYRAPRVAGERVRLGERATGDLALIFHELATNAAKYGALSVDAGTVGVDWKIEKGKLVLRWREENGPEVAQPNKEGFGSALLQGTMASYRGRLDHDWSRSGLVVDLEMPVDRLTH